MYPEESCFGLNLIINEIKISSLTVVPSLGKADALSRQVFPFSNGDMVLVLMKEISPHPYLLLILPADHFRIDSRSVVFLTVSCVLRGSTDHNSELREHPPAAYAVENARVLRDNTISSVSSIDIFFVLGLSSTSTLEGSFGVDSPTALVVVTSLFLAHLGPA